MNENEKLINEKDGIEEPDLKLENADTEGEEAEGAVSSEETDTNEIPEEEAQGSTDAEDSDENVGLTDAERLSAVTDPMFPTFAKGKNQPLDELISDFIKMTSLGASEPRLSKMALATPRGSSASPDYALSERQRKLAESAGMSYREYYNFLKTMK